MWCEPPKAKPLRVNNLGLLCSKTLVFFGYLGTELEQIILSDVCGLPGATYRCVSTKISQITRRINATIYYRLQSFLEAKDKLRRICVSSLSCTHWLTHQSPGMISFSGKKTFEVFADHGSCWIYCWHVIAVLRWSSNFIASVLSYVSDCLCWIVVGMCLAVWSKVACTSCVMNSCLHMLYVMKSCQISISSF